MVDLKVDLILSAIQLMIFSWIFWGAMHPRVLAEPRSIEERFNEGLLYQLEP